MVLINVYPVLETQKPPPQITNLEPLMLVPSYVTVRLDISRMAGMMRVANVIIGAKLVVELLIIVKVTN